MAHLAAGARLALAVEMQLSAGLGENLAPGQNLVADQILHHRPRVMLDRSQRQAADGAHELLELAGDTGIDRPVAGLMRPLRQLVDQYLADFATNISTARRPTTSSASATRAAIASALVSTGSGSTAGAMVSSRM